MQSVETMAGMSFLMPSNSITNQIEDLISDSKDNCTVISFGLGKLGWPGLLSKFSLVRPILF